MIYLADTFRSYEVCSEAVTPRLASSFRGPVSPFPSMLHPISGGMDDTNI